METNINGLKDKLGNKLHIIVQSIAQVVGLQEALDGKADVVEFISVRTDSPLSFSKLDDITEKGVYKGIVSYSNSAARLYFGAILRVNNTRRGTVITFIQELEYNGSKFTRSKASLQPWGTWSAVNDTINIEDVEGLEQALNGKAALNHSHSEIRHSMQEDDIYVSCDDDGIALGVETGEIFVNQYNIGNLSRALEDPDTTPTADSDSLVTSGAVASTLNNKIDIDDFGGQDVEVLTATKEEPVNIDSYVGNKRFCVVYIESQSNEATLGELISGCILKDSDDELSASYGSIYALIVFNTGHERFAFVSPNLDA